MPSLRKRIAWWNTTTAAQRRNFRIPTRLNDLEGRLRQWLPDANDERDFADHMFGRLNDFRHTVVPWLDAARRLHGARILEIGCGTGPSTLALAEQGAIVTGIDPDGLAIEVAKARCEAFGVDASFQVANVTDLVRDGFLPGYDFVLFFASLEHMTWDERRTGLRLAASVVRPSGFLGVIEAPNRLWFHDSHTTSSNFFHWLPDEIVVEYLVDHGGFRSTVANYVRKSADRSLALARAGRNVSFHDFDLALNSKPELHSSMDGFLRRRNQLRLLQAWSKGSLRYERFLRRLAPDRSRGWFHEYLNVLIQVR